MDYAYNAFGDEGLMRSRKQTKNTLSEKKKISVVELYLSVKFHIKTAIQEGIKQSEGMITGLIFRAAGPDALKTHRKVERKHWISLR